jgi:pantoate--beta-alanine ligase
MQLVHDTAELAPSAGGAFVPTMGALHEGHLSLIRRAATLGGPVVVSIFVNPTQFAPDEDLTQYPRDLDGDAARAAEAGADIIFAPDVPTIYPPDAPVAVPPLPDVVHVALEDAQRPHHFAGVAQAVARLFDLVRPSVAVFGEKDYQQLLMIEALAAVNQERWPGLRIERGAIVRESDGLAMSSRNAYLTDDERPRARGLVRALQTAHAAQHPGTAEATMRSTLEAHGLKTDYAVVRDAKTLQPVNDLSRPTRALIAARLGRVRLIDNGAMTVWR